MLALWRDTRYALRVLSKAPGFAAVVIFILALGIGANTAIFTVVNAVLLKPLPFSRPEQLVDIQRADRRIGEAGPWLSYLDFTDLRAQSRSLQSVAGYDRVPVILTGAGDPVHVSAEIVSTDMFRLLRVSPILGRDFAASEDKPGTSVATLSYALWKSRFAGSSSVLGKQIVLDEKPFTVIGVMPADFAFPVGEPSADLYTTMAVESDNFPRRDARFLRVIGRLRDGSSLAAASVENSEIAAGLAMQYPDTNAHIGLSTQSQLETLTNNVRPALLIVLGAVGFLLLIACANSANLLLARAASRQREMAIRASLGASRGRIVAQLLTESALLALAGGTLGFLLAAAGTAALANLSQLAIPRLESAGIDWRAFAFTALLSLLTAAVFGVAPALQASRLNLFNLLREGGRAASGGVVRSRLRGLLAVSQVSLAVILLIGASLLLETVFHLMHQSPGFAPQGLFTFHVDLPLSRYSKPGQTEDFFRDLYSRILTVPGVKNASGVLPLPLSGVTNRVSFEIVGKPVPASDIPRAHLRVVGVGYFAAMQIPFLAGRDFSTRDNLESSRVAIINQTMAERFFPNGNAVGQRIKSNTGWAPTGTEDYPLEIIAVVGDVKHKNLWQAPDPELYVGYEQFSTGTMDVVVRAEKEPMALLPGVRAQLMALDPGVAIYRPQPMLDYAVASVAQQRTTSTLCAVFAAVGLVLAVVGLFGVLSYSVAQRTHEIGVRLAVGAEKKDILGLILKEGMAITILGVAAGLATALGLSKVIRSELYGVTATDPLTFLGVSLGLGFVALLACYIPARRAVRVDPIVALRYE
jgi:putative ABC transport system permease protein